MKNIPAKNIQRIILIIALLFGLNLTTTAVYAQDADASEKIQLLSEALFARDTGDLLLAKEKLEVLIALAPNDKNVQALLISVNQSIEDEGLVVPDAEPESLTVVEDEIVTELDSQPTSVKSISKNILGKSLLPAEEVSPIYVAQKETVEDLLLVANSQIAIGDLAGATSTLLEIEARDPNSKEAKLLSLKLSQALENVQGLNLYKTRENMLNAVNNSWEQPKVFELEDFSKSEEVAVPSLIRKLEKIVLPKINFTGMALTRVIETLSELSLEYDSEGQGVNIVPMFDSSEYNPKVNITLRNLSLDKILQFVTQQVNFTYEVGAEVVTIQPSDSIGGSSSTITEFFPLSRATVIRITGFRDTSATSNVDDPFGDVSVNYGQSQDQEKDALQKFLQNAGVNFEGVTGSSLAFDGEQLIVTQTPRNIERLRTILRNYNETKQVEIETKFLEVSQNDLDELGFHWGIGSNKTGEDWRVASNLRSLNSIGNTSTSNRARLITGDATQNPNNEESFLDDPVLINPPAVGQALTFGTAASFFSDSTSSTLDSNGNPLTTGFSVDDLNIDLEIQALARKTGSDLMSAPKVTVLSGKRANIVVAQELRYPRSYGDIESTVSSGGSGGSSSVAITAGTPQDFDKRNVGVEMSVTPNVENDNTITLELSPRVTEFEGFVEYGGPSIALGDGTTAVVPAGFYQPVFSTREITTEVNIYDGATVVMGGLTRDEVRSINDKVPFLGDIPGLGRLFRSEGETRQKRNLLIFVTANLVSPGGSLTNQSYDNVKSNTIYQTPALVTPAGGNYRNVTIKD